MTIGELIRSNRRRLDMSQGELADKVNLYTEKISRIERGKQQPIYEDAIAMLRAVGIDTKHPLIEQYYMRRITND